MGMNDATAFSTPHILDALQRVHRQRLSGELSFPYGNGLCTLTVAEGDIVALDTVTARERLVPFLKERGADPTDLLTGATNTVSLGRIEQLRALIAEYIGRLVNELANPKLAVLINFKPSVTGSPDRVRHKIASLLLQLYDQWLDGGVIEALLPDRQVRVRVAPDAMSRIRGLPLTTRQGFLFSRLHDGLTVDELVRSGGLQEEEVLRALLALDFMEVITLKPGDESGPKAVRNEPPLARPAAPRAAPQPAPATAVPRPAPRATPPPQRAATLPAANATAPSSETVPPELMAELEDLFILAQNGNHYELLGVDYRAETDEIKKSYVELTKRFHPDHFNRFNNPALQARVDALFAQITEAAETLKDPARRANYNEKYELDKTMLKPQSIPARAGPEKENTKLYAYEDREHIAKQHYTHGKEAFKAQKFYDATEHFRQAVRILPDVAEYQFWLGRTLSLNPQRYKEAEERLLKAQEMKPDRIEILLELARFYNKIKLHIRAQKFYQRVYELKPDNEEARQALGIKKERGPITFKGLLKMDLKNFLKSDDEK
ncbi:MAG TPA: J domain-containing protein [Acidobacteriota bacterium]|nr:J domain-containing protein [Acidobacteriota bacterium]HQK87129.1 J domain-containing protein [Acidobacteriota bacterium]